jgi:hypothetical protein
VEETIMKAGEEANPAEMPVRQTMIERLAEKVGRTNARTVYGDAVINDGVTVIPVAKVAYGFGGGEGEGEQGQGDGGGGGAVARPVGYIEIKDGETTFRRIRDPLAMAPLVIAGGVAGAMLLRGLYKLVRRGVEPTNES